MASSPDRADPDPQSAFIVAATAPREGGHRSGDLARADALLAAHPEIAGGSIHAAAILGDAKSVRAFLERDPASATAKGGPHDWDALTHLCFSRYLKLDPARSAGFVQAATALLDAGASANSGFWEPDHQPAPEWEPVLYGAAGIAHHAAMTRLLLERGAEPNDVEVVYHTPESYDNDAMKVLAGTGRLTPMSLSMMLVRKHDLHDADGVAWLLANGADPNFVSHWCRTPFQHGVLRDNALAILATAMDHGAHPASTAGEQSAMAIAARRGRGDLLALFEARGFPIDLEGVDRLIAACAGNDAAGVRAIAEREPALVAELVESGGALLGDFAGVDNTNGVRHLLDLGVPVDASYAEPGGYWGVGRGSTALHVAAWRASHPTVALLIERGAPVNARDARGRTPLMLAVRACVDSYWTRLRAPDSVDALLRNGASIDGVPYPSGYEPVDERLRQQRADS
jgi:ankyrin repeat protein